MTHLIEPDLSNRQRQIIIGTILGGSSIIKPSKGRNCYLSMRSKDSSWLEYKAFELDCLSSEKPFTLERTNRWHSLCYPCFNVSREKFYKKNKRVLNLYEMELLTDVAWSIWFGDCGKLDKENIILNTHVWGEKGSKTIIKYFKLIDYKSEVIKERGNFRVKLNPEASIEFMKVAYPQLPYFFATRLAIPSHIPNRGQ